MKKIYVGHSKDFNFIEELYQPLRDSELNKHFEIILPHEQSEKPFNSREELKNVSYMIAEVTYPATGLGIEIGWALMLGVPVIAIYKTGTKISSSVRMLAQEVIEYSTVKELIEKLSQSVKP